MLSTPPLRLELAVCLNSACGTSERLGVHSYQERRYKCHACGTTFAETIDTPLYGLKHPTWLVVLVLTLLAYGCPIPAIVAAFTLDERTVADRQQKAGQHAKQLAGTDRLPGAGRTGAGASYRVGPKGGVQKFRRSWGSSEQWVLSNTWSGAILCRALRLTLGEGVAIVMDYRRSSQEQALSVWWQPGHLAWLLAHWHA